MKWNPEKKDHVKVFEYDDGTTEVEGENQPAPESLEHSVKTSDSTNFTGIVSLISSQAEP